MNKRLDGGMLSLAKAKAPDLSGFFAGGDEDNQRCANDTTNQIPSSLHATCEQPEFSSTQRIDFPQSSVRNERTASSRIDFWIDRNESYFSTRMRSHESQLLANCHPSFYSLRYRYPQQVDASGVFADIAFYGDWTPKVMRRLQDQLGLTLAHLKWLQDTLISAKVPLRRPFLPVHIDTSLKSQVKPILLASLTGHTLMASNRECRPSIESITLYPRQRRHQELSLQGLRPRDFHLLDYTRVSPSPPPLPSCQQISSDRRVIGDESQVGLEVEMSADKQLIPVDEMVFSSMAQHPVPETNEGQNTVLQGDREEFKPSDQEAMPTCVMTTNMSPSLYPNPIQEKSVSTDALASKDMFSSDDNDESVVSEDCEGVAVEPSAVFDQFGKSDCLEFVTQERNYSRDNASPSLEASTRGSKQTILQPTMAVTTDESAVGIGSCGASDGLPGGVGVGECTQEYTMEHESSDHMGVGASDRTVNQIPSNPSVPGSPSEVSTADEIGVTDKSNYVAIPAGSSCSSANPNGDQHGIHESQGLQALKSKYSDSLSPPAKNRNMPVEINEPQDKRRRLSINPCSRLNEGEVVADPSERLSTDNTHSSEADVDGGHHKASSVSGSITASGVGDYSDKFNFGVGNDSAEAFARDAVKSSAVMRSGLGYENITFQLEINDVIKRIFSEFEATVDEKPVTFSLSVDPGSESVQVVASGELLSITKTGQGALFLLQFMDAMRQFAVLSASWRNTVEDWAELVLERLLNDYCGAKATILQRIRFVKDLAAKFEHKSVVGSLQKYHASYFELVCRDSSLILPFLCLCMCRNSGSENFNSMTMYRACASMHQTNFMEYDVCHLIQVFCDHCEDVIGGNTVKLTYSPPDSAGLNPLILTANLDNHSVPVSKKGKGTGIQMQLVYALSELCTESALLLDFVINWSQKVAFQLLHVEKKHARMAERLKVLAAQSGNPIIYDWLESWTGLSLTTTIFVGNHLLLPYLCFSLSKNAHVSPLDLDMVLVLGQKRFIHQPISYPSADTTQCTDGNVPPKRPNGNMRRRLALNAARAKRLVLVEAYLDQNGTFPLEVDEFQFSELDVQMFLRSTYGFCFQPRAKAQQGDSAGALLPDSSSVSGDSRAPEEFADTASPSTCISLGETSRSKPSTFASTEVCPSTSPTGTTDGLPHDNPESEGSASVVVNATCPTEPSSSAFVLPTHGTVTAQHRKALRCHKKKFLKRKRRREEKKAAELAAQQS